jgi:predicted O-methyltransferase YrrM
VVIARCLNRGPIIELGTLFGHTSLLLTTVKDDEQELLTVDNYSWNPFMMPADDHE